MTENKKSPNPFINMANNAKKNSPTPTNKKVHNTPKLSKGYKGTTVVRRSGRGG